MTNLYSQERTIYFKSFIFTLSLGRESNFFKQWIHHYIIDVKRENFSLRSNTKIDYFFPEKKRACDGDKTIYT